MHVGEPGHQVPPTAVDPQEFVLPPPGTSTHLLAYFGAGSNGRDSTATDQDGVVPQDPLIPHRDDVHVFEEDVRGGEEHHKQRDHGFLRTMRAMNLPAKASGFLLALVACAALCRPAVAQDLHFAADRPLDLRHVRVEAKVDLRKKSLVGRATLSLTALRKTETVRLDAVNLDVKAVEALVGEPAQKQAVEWTNDGRSLEIALAHPAKRGTAVRLTIDYVCAEPERGLFFFGPTKRQPDVPYQVWSQGETVDNRHWIPLFDHPNERVSSELLIRVPKDEQVLSNGRRVAVKDHGDGTHTWHWSQEKEHAPYLITLVVGQFAIKTDTWRGRPVEYWVPPDREADTMRSFENTKPMLDFFSDKIGVEYPWAKYTQVVVEQFSFGGMENTTATTLSERTLHDERAHLDYSSDGLVAHELAHQWFGDLLTCRDWAHTWLNEGFATYFQALWTEKNLGRDEFLYDLLGKQRAAIRGGKKLPIVHRAYKGPWQQFDARAYPKGAWVLHMIRRRLGDEAWWKAVRHYVTKNRNRAVETADFRHALEEATGRSIERFFYDWTSRRAHPVLKITHGWNARDKTATVRIQQTQKDKAWHFPLRIEYGFRNLSRVFAVTHNVTEKDIRFVVPLPARPHLVRIDPTNAVLMELTEHKGRNLWVAQLLEDDNPLLRIRAAEYFGKSKKKQDRELLAQALGQEAFWGVQAEIAKALGKTGGDLARTTLLKALSLEHPKARREAVKALGLFKNDETVRDELLAVINNGDASYSVEAEAVTAWANLRADGAVKALVPLLGRKSHNHGIRTAVLRGIGQQRDVSATKLLLEWTKPHHERPSRSAAIDALGTMAEAGLWDRAAEKEVVDALTACLDRREHRRIKNAAGGALRKLGNRAAPALEALDAMAEHDLNPNVRKQAKETADKIRSGQEPHIQLKRLREELNKLRRAIKKQEPVERKQATEVKGAK